MNLEKISQIFTVIKNYCYLSKAIVNPKEFLPCCPRRVWSSPYNPEGIRLRGVRLWSNLRIFDLVRGNTSSTIQINIKRDKFKKWKKEEVEYKLDDAVGFASFVDSSFIHFFIANHEMFCLPDPVPIERVAGCEEIPSIPERVLLRVVRPLRSCSIRLGRHKIVLSYSKRKRIRIFVVRLEWNKRCMYEKIGSIMFGESK